MSKRSPVAKGKSNRSRDEAVTLFKRADAEWERGRNKRALELFQEAARLGESSAQHNVGFIYDVGLGVRKDANKAMLWYRRAWRTGRQTDTCINIAKLYASKGNTRGALTWWRKAISLGDGDAALDLAKFYLSKQNQNKTRAAIAMLRKARTAEHISEEGRDEAFNLLRALSL